MKNILSLSIENLVLLEEIDRTGVLLRAGEALNISPSAASRMFSKIRRALGDECFVQVQGRYEPTEHYKRVQPQVRAIIEAAMSLEVGNFDPAGCRRSFRVSSMMAEIGHVVGGVLPMMLAEAPHARLDLRKKDDEFEAVMSGAVDFAVVTAVDLPPDVHVLRLYPVDRVVLMRRGHPLSGRGDGLTMEELRSCDRVSIRTGRSNSWTGPDQSLFPNERYMERTRFSTSRFNTAWEAMEKTDLIAVCGWRAAEMAMRSNDLVALPLPKDADVPNHWNVLIWSESRHRDPASRWLRGLFARWARMEEERARRLYEAGAWVPRRIPKP